MAFEEEELALTRDIIREDQLGQHPDEEQTLLVPSLALDHPNEEPTPRIGDKVSVVLVLPSSVCTPPFKGLVGRVTRVEAWANGYVVDVSIGGRGLTFLDKELALTQDIIREGDA